MAVERGMPDGAAGRDGGIEGGFRHGDGGAGGVHAGAGFAQTGVGGERPVHQRVERGILPGRPPAAEIGRSGSVGGGGVEPLRNDWRRDALAGRRRCHAAGEQQGDGGKGVTVHRASHPCRASICRKRLMASVMKKAPQAAMMASCGSTMRTSASR
ncbi:hypothetical protein NOLU111490_16940 [Novosphingobium lubricantis]